MYQKLCQYHNSLKGGQEMCHFTLALLPSGILQYLNEYFCHHNLHTSFGPSNNKQQPIRAEFKFSNEERNPVACDETVSYIIVMAQLGQNGKDAHFGPPT